MDRIHNKEEDGIMRVLCVGDIHGRSEALKQCLNRASFNNKKDTLVCLGDVVDGGKNAKQVVGELLKIKNLVLVKGNHDQWFKDWFEGGDEEPIWTHQGGIATLRSYGFKRENVPETHKELFRNAKLYHIDGKNRVFVHGGFDPEKPVEEQSESVLTWDRSLITYAMGKVIKQFSHVFVGHTTTQVMGAHWEVPNCEEPITFNNLTMTDTGAGFNGKLSVLDVDTFEYWQSDKQSPNYDDCKGCDFCTKDKGY